VVSGQCYWLTPIPSPVFHISITNVQTAHPIEDNRLEAAVRAILKGERVRSAKVSVAIVDDATIHRLNREYLQHDESTDVLSFVLEKNESTLEGEVVVCVDTAAATAARFGWATADELLLYTVHGTLHLLGYDDQTPVTLREMRERERHYLLAFGLTPRYDEVVQTAAVQGV
jgi:probable rRNA maturation factor